MLFKSLSGKSRFTKRLFFLSFLSLAFSCLSTSPIQADQQGEIYGWGSLKALNGRTLTNISKIAAGSSHSLALKSDGSIVGWGKDYYGQATPPDGNDFIAVAAGELHSLALKSDGSIVGWGRDDDGQATPPAGNNYVAIAAGGFHNLALKSDGSIIGWGDNRFGQAMPPAGTGFIAIAAGGWHSLALKAPVQAQIQLTPQTLNCDSKGKWLKAHVISPEEIYAEDIDVNTPAIADPPGIESEFIEVFDNGQGRFDVQIYFDRESFCQALSESEDGLLEVTVTGSFIDGRKFQSSDTIKLKSKLWQHRNSNLKTIINHP